MIVVIDNYDSFTYNLVQYLGELGQEIVVYRNDQVTIEEIKEINPDHIVISPGPGTPDDGGVSLEVLKAFGENTPIFGVCLGHQCIGQALWRQSRSCAAFDAWQNLLRLSQWGWYLSQVCPVRSKQPVTIR